ncbi:hypothetical protein L682_13560 [Aquipseudomonas alcaligenes OT 69]|nr:hypothetical protein L682_13560 [Pseudomonas alcaligenes OT 69]
MSLRELVTVTPVLLEGITRNTVVPRTIRVPLLQFVDALHAVPSAFVGQILIASRSVTASLRAICIAPTSVLVELVSRLSRMRLLKLGNPIETRMASMSSATSSSMRVNPLPEYMVKSRKIPRRS